MQLGRVHHSICIVQCLLACMMLVAGPVSAQPALTVGVSILPQKYFVKRIAGNKANVVVMVEPGYNPATYEAKPKQLSRLQEAILYFLVGVPFENKWMNAIVQVNPDLKIIPLPDGIEFRVMSDSVNFAAQTEAHKNSHNHSSMTDPHIWLNPRLVKQLALAIKAAFIAIDPDNIVFYEENYKDFVNDLEQLDHYIRTQLKTVKARQFMVFHPSWGYFGDEYGLRQIAIELEGKHPGAKTLSQLIELARREQVKVIFVQKQFSDRDAKTIAEHIGAKIVYVDPLAENYLDNLKHTTHLFVEALK